MPSYNRRQFLRVTGTTSLAAVAAHGAGRGVSILTNADPIAFSGPVQWAAKELEQSLTAAGVTVQRCVNISEVAAGNQCILVAGSSTDIARQILKPAGITVLESLESLGIAPGTLNGKSVLLATGFDVRGLVFALLDLADRVQNNPDPSTALLNLKASAEQPANKIRSITRLFTSDVEDKVWYNDRAMWPQYLTMLAANRFNRFNLALGIGYDFIRQVTDAYFLFSYPFLLAVPGYKVRSPQLPDAERDQNLEMLRFIARETVARGMEFQLGLWMHGYEWINSPNPNYTIEGITKENHGPYCRDAVRALLQSIPEISGVTFRVHGESGVEEGSYDFWKTVFEGVATCGRRVEIDMHAKGMDETMMNMAVATKQPVIISPKYWAEHLGMPYHQADIRELERPRPDRTATGLMKFSAGSRSFLRYGYGDLLRENRQWGVLHRIWPGTQRLLLSGDPVTTAAHSRAFRFCGSDGVEIMEPLSFKGRRGSGIAGDRCAYEDASLTPRWDWQKYLYTHRVWGRLLYNPDAKPEVWQRLLRKDFGAGAPGIETALANATRILPIIMTSHAASAGNNTYWPELYLNQTIVDPEHFGPYRDTPTPRVFGNVSPLDPQLFSGINEFTDELLQGARTGRYTPLEAAQWIEDYGAQAVKSLAQATPLAAGKNKPEFRRLAIDIKMQAGLARFFGAKFRSGALYRVYERSGNPVALDQAVKAYRSARASWVELVTLSKGVYRADITVGENPQLRGHWADRLPAIDADIAMMETKRGLAINSEISEAKATAVIGRILGRQRRQQLPCKHRPGVTFQPGQPIELALAVTQTGQPVVVHLHYRHVTQAERYESLEMQFAGGTYHASIPGKYTASVYPMEYYFELKHSQGEAWLYPGFNADLANQPYFVLRQQS